MNELDRLWSRRNIERIVLSQIPSELLTERDRRYIKKSAKHINTAWKMGLHDGRRGVPKQGAPRVEGDSLASVVFKAALSAYEAGYTVGALGKG